MVDIGGGSVREFGIDPDAREFRTEVRIKPTTVLTTTNATTRDSFSRRRSRWNVVDKPIINSVSSWAPALESP